MGEFDKGKMIIYYVSVSLCLFSILVYIFTVLCLFQCFKVNLEVNGRNEPKLVKSSETGAKLES